MPADPLMLAGQYVRLEPLGHIHADGLAAASAADPTLYQWSPVPQGKAAAAAYIDTALALQNAGTANPFVIIRTTNNEIIGSTRFWNIERWAWPPDHPRHGRAAPDACEIGHTWFTRSAIRTAANTEAKLLMLTHAFETWQALRICFHTDARNQRSRAALERIGAKFEGILRAHRMAADYIPRDSMRFSLIAEEWPAAREMLVQLLNSRS